MYHFYFDASALVKRYTEEHGSRNVDYLFVNIPLNQLKCLSIGAAEVFWICVRKKNDGRITPYEFTHAVVNLNREVTSDESDFQTFPAPDPLVWASLNLIETYSLNSVDAMVLRSALEEGIQDVGRYAYRLVEVLDKEAASVDERPPPIP